MRAILLGVKGGTMESEKTGKPFEWCKIFVSSLSVVDDESDSHYSFGFQVDSISVLPKIFRSSFAVLKDYIGKDVDVVYDHVFGYKNPQVVDIKLAGEEVE